MDKVIEWLLSGEPWVAYRTRIDLLHESENDAAVRKARKEILGHPWIVKLLEEVNTWPGTVLASHKSANQTYHKLAFLADIGLDKNDPPIAETIRKILEHQSDEGPFELRMNVSEHFGGSGKDEWAWALCDAPVILHSLIEFGLAKDKNARKAINYLVPLVRDNGWPCVVSKKLGSFRGPGRKDDPCPYATMIMVKMLLALDDDRYIGEIMTGAKSLLDLWERSKETHPYIFYMGTDFRKLKLPFIWYDLIHILDILTKIKELKNNTRLAEMVTLLKSKADKEGRYTPESIYQTWKDWDFGQKKAPSRWVTLAAMRILARTKK